MINRKTYGVGYNSGGKYKTKEFGKRLRVYQTWKDMLRRCYDKKRQVRDYTYTGCSVDERWHDFQVFAEWCSNNNLGSSDYHIDKDILVRGNKVYSPETCCLVPKSINGLFNNHSKGRGEFPQGVYWNKSRGLHVAKISISGKSKHLGYFDCPNKAHEVYKKAKESHVKEMADLWFSNIEPRVYEALMDWKLK